MSHKRLVLQMVSLTLVVLLSAACATSLSTSTSVPPTLIPPTPIPPTPVPATPVPSTVVAGLNPSPRGYVSMAYDKESDRVILFGGQTGDIIRDPSQNSGETWAYDVAANKWTVMKPPSGPTGRGAADMTYDAESDRVILFGGANNEVGWNLNDTWAYDFNTNTWKEMAPGPFGHLGCRIAYDAESDRVILFGGYLMESNKLLNDTWSYDFNSDTWTEMKPSTSPYPRNFHAMAYDAESDRVIMWGSAGDGDLSMWAYDYNKNTWEKKAPVGGPEFREYISMAYNAKADRIILYGGSDHYEVGNDETWAYDYNANLWTQLEPATTAGIRSQYAMAYSTAADRVILFGGAKGKRFLFSEETWVYDLKAKTWTNVTPHP